MDVNCEFRGDFEDVVVAAAEPADDDGEQMFAASACVAAKSFFIERRVRLIDKVASLARLLLVDYPTAACATFAAAARLELRAPPHHWQRRSE